MTILLIFNNDGIVQIFRYENPDLERIALLRECQGCYLYSTNEKEYSEKVRNFLLSLSDPIFDETEIGETIKIQGDSEIIICGAL